MDINWFYSGTRSMGRELERGGRTGNYPRCQFPAPNRCETITERPGPPCIVQSQNQQIFNSVAPLRQTSQQEFRRLTKLLSEEYSVLSSYRIVPTSSTSEPFYEPRMMKRGGVMILTMVHTQDSATYFRVISFTHDWGSFRKKNPPRRQTMPYASYATTLPSSAVDHGCNVCSPKMHSPTETNLMSVMLLGKMDADRPTVLVPAGRAGTGASRSSIAGMKLPHFLRGLSTITTCTTACSTAD
ncbi:hypothetical protein BO79DRAFT_230526 [Aspergillus costaricaensis CBS 115574]|uniref:Uncharacterized protein n=1 Tax=Aspergillus costaricaensis CBS 115574 TaxID=1448317 RepID=A0ACD1I7Y7_9EURO|nr:hypothetical protein BO79DRAFT_230526 [Aspergillus costaricaensis CBS 115574]RAK86474.1 hypothetical protein BO79DRAFT_230526 [Aspergillus costaricaensis CBS 115574]